MKTNVAYPKTNVVLLYVLNNSCLHLLFRRRNVYLNFEIHSKFLRNAVYCPLYSNHLLKKKDIITHWNKNKRYCHENVASTNYSCQIAYILHKWLSLCHYAFEESVLFCFFLSTSIRSVLCVTIIVVYCILQEKLLRMCFLMTWPIFGCVWNWLSTFLKQ
jgi:hypothetical protein